MAALDNGLILRIDPDWFAVCPPLIAEDSDIDDLADRIERSLEQAMATVGHRRVRHGSSDDHTIRSCASRRMTLSPTPFTGRQATSA